MWTTSSFRADTARVLMILLGIAVYAAGQQPRAGSVAPDAPRPAPPQSKQPPRPTNYEVKQPVELRSVTAGRLDKERQALAGPEFVKTAKDPLFIEVKTAPGILGKPAMGAAPVILLNGERLLSTRGAGRDTLIAFLPDREKIKDTNSVAVVWLGKQEPTMTRKPLEFRRVDIKE